MGEVTGIEWCDHTFNPWIGCTRVSAACDHCYAESLARRYGWAKWGAGETRGRTSPANWRKPIAWNKAAAAAGIRRRVFCASLADVFDAEVDDRWRRDLMFLIVETPHLDWLLLTKRPQVAKKFFDALEMVPPNVWMGTTVEDQKMADLRIPILLSIPARVRFLSCEPLLAPIDLSRWLDRTAGGRFHAEPILDWVIAGGESGPKARPSHPDWFRSLRDQCRTAGVAFHFKQWGEWQPSAMHDPEACPYKSTHAIHVGGAREFRPSEAFYKSGTQPGWAGVCQVGKKRAGAELDGREHREFPT